MQLYVVVGIYQGELSHIRGFIDPGEAEMELARLGGEPEVDAQIYEIDVDARPTSVAMRRQIW